MRPQHFFRPARSALVAAALALASAQAMAACTIRSVSAVTFGAYDVFAAVADTGTGSFSVSNCSGGGRTYTARLSVGTTPGATYSTRLMRNGSNYLQYNLYKDTLYAQIWGDGTGGTVTLVNTNSNSRVGPTHTIYGRIPAGQDLPVGVYTDTIVITITF